MRVGREMLETFAYCETAFMLGRLARILLFLGFGLCSMGVRP